MEQTKKGVSQALYSTSAFWYVKHYTKCRDKATYIFYFLADPILFWKRKRRSLKFHPFTHLFPLTIPA